MQPPLLSALTVIADRARLVLTRQMLTQLTRQTYTNFNVVIVNATDTPVFTSHNERVIEVRVDPLVSLTTPAALRNVGIKASAAPWVILTDDDDVHHPQYFNTMMAHRRDGAACLLSYQLRVDISPQAGMSALIVYGAGVPGTMLFPRVVGGQPVQFDETAVENVERKCLDKHFGDQVVVVENDPSRFPGPLTHIAVWHGRNVLSREAFFGEFAAPAHAHRWAQVAVLGGPAQSEFDKYVIWAMQQRGLNLSIHGAEGDGKASA